MPVLYHDFISIHFRQNTIELMNNVLFFLKTVYFLIFKRVLQTKCSRLGKKLRKLKNESLMPENWMPNYWTPSFIWLLLVMCRGGCCQRQPGNFRFGFSSGSEGKKYLGFRFGLTHWCPLIQPRVRLPLDSLHAFASLSSTSLQGLPTVATCPPFEHICPLWWITQLSHQTNPRVLQEGWRKRSGANTRRTRR